MKRKRYIEDRIAELREMLGESYRVCYVIINYQHDAILIRPKDKPDGGVRLFINPMEAVFDNKTGLYNYETITNRA